jgi:precorrin-2 dehydrogenase/sirohydrochlorin ferrochelatase
VYPILLDVTGRWCVVVGGGKIGERRAIGLAEQGATVRIVSPSITDRLADLEAFEWIRCEYGNELIDGAFLVIAATDSAKVNAQVVSDCRARNILVSSASVADDGDFIVPASIRREDLLVTVSTLGASPTLASVLREDIEKQYGPEWAAMTSIMGLLREELNLRHATEDWRKRAVRAVLASEPVWEAIRRGDAVEAEALARRCL